MKNAKKNRATGGYAASQDGASRLGPPSPPGAALCPRDAAGRRTAPGIHPAPSARAPGLEGWRPLDGRLGWTPAPARRFTLGTVCRFAFRAPADPPLSRLRSWRLASSSFGLLAPRQLLGLRLALDGRPESGGSAGACQPGRRCRSDRSVRPWGASHSLSRAWGRGIRSWVPRGCAWGRTPLGSSARAVARSEPHRQGSPWGAHPAFASLGLGDAPRSRWGGCAPSSGAGRPGHWLKATPLNGALQQGAPRGGAMAECTSASCTGDRGCSRVWPELLGRRSSRGRLVGRLKPGWRARRLFRSLSAYRLSRMFSHRPPAFPAWHGVRSGSMAASRRPRVPSSVPLACTAG